MAEQYQLFSPLAEAEFSALKEDIRKRGILVPVEIDDETGAILDGHHRHAIATELGIECPTVRRKLASEEDRIDHVLKINLLRRHMDPVSWAEAFARLLEVRGVERRRGPKRKGGIELTVSQMAEEVGVPLATAKRRLSLLDLPEKKKEAVRAGEKSAKQAKREVEKEQKKAQKAKAKATVPESLPPVPERCSLIHAPISEAAVDPDSIDWIITDPPYPRDALHLYDELGAFASRTLVDGGSLVCMVGQSYLPAIVNALQEHLEYHWTLSYLTPGGQSVQLWERRVNTFWKPLLWLTKGKRSDSADWIGDVCRSKTNDNDKRHHGWGQSESGMRDIVNRFTYPGDVICDPFLGGGTTGVVALEMNRTFIGIDCDQAAIDAFRSRVKA